MIWDTIGGYPGTQLAFRTFPVTANATGQTAGVGGWYEYLLDFSIPDFTAIGGTTYWLGLHNGDVDGPFLDTNYSYFYWETTGPNSTFSALEYDLSTFP